MVEDSQKGRKDLTIWFPRLLSDPHFRIKSRRTSQYNCIAWAMRISGLWVDPVKVPGHWWPQNAPRDTLAESLVTAFRCVGFEVCADDIPEPFYDKVALYGRVGFWQHAARVIGEGVYHSKMGALWDISHRSGDVFEGTDYGYCYCFMKRPKYKRILTILAVLGLHEKRIVKSGSCSI